ncbi:4-hydroxybenzoate polyprenyltransferase [Jiangella ureilytica]|uniref:4-hydroxybenzoate polyprenyltransferase n=1 Tax=Jiangella ureilytica TaxID=2530374 RepID=A0A4R4RTQ9_9ACTN|nr:UbiA family prenyltransferase [Jiangella ureilytica]TDC53437.1 4-hydroxybenzoate polyprenyltransferase [Jiangella ureilytica]
MRFRDVVELVRAPAALTVPGDSLAGAAAAGFPYGARTAVTPLASACLYWAGMALNDYADRDLDRLERPERPIPSGRVTPSQALGLAAGLTAAGLGLAAAAGGRPALRVAVPLAATVWAYDLLVKPTPAGPVAMAAARGLDVLLGAGGRERAAALPALAVAVHTAGVTVLSRGEVHGASPSSGRFAVGATAAASLAAALPALRRAAVPSGAASVRSVGPALSAVHPALSAVHPALSAVAPDRSSRWSSAVGSDRRPLTRVSALPSDTTADLQRGNRRFLPAGSARGLAAAGFAGVYAATVGRAQLGAARQPDAATVRSATGAGVRGVIPLQSALLARAGAVVLAGAVVGIGPAVRALSKVVSPT